MATHEYQVNDLEPWQRSHHAAQREIARLRAALEVIADKHPVGNVAFEMIRIARAALKGDDA